VPVEPTSPKVVRCAIYTRKSTEEGLQQEFNSLDAQREAAEAFITSQKHEGWQAIPYPYDDGGYTGLLNGIVVVGAAEVGVVNRRPGIGQRFGRLFFEPVLED